MTGELFETEMTLGIDKVSENYNNNVVLGDLNFDMLKYLKKKKRKHTE